MKTKCYNPKCLHERDYKGKFIEDNDVITCTKCRYKLRLGKARIDSEVRGEVGIPHEQPHEVTSQIKEESESTSLFGESINKLCSVHNLPARYSSFDKKWICNECNNFPLPKNVKELTSHLGSVKEIIEDIEINEIGFDPLVVLKKNNLISA